MRQHIAAGDTYQCNLTDRLCGHADGDVRALYADLALAQRCGYDAFLDPGRHVIAGASPELFLSKPATGFAPVP
ncbi:chorismate-binding protein [Blastococcus mobilis]|uniref:chorismate-binding protein n=1 Tax=Blastococcus mobilis TaxID=1938746 RepID=UPI001C3CB106